MTLETVIVAAKGACVTGSTTLLALSSGLSQWSNEPSGPSTLQWVMIIGSSAGAGLGSLGAFLSGSFGNYVAKRKGINISETPQATTNDTKP